MEYIDEETYEPELKNNFMKLQSGENIIRITTPTLHFKKHELKTDGKYQTKICEGENCPLCQQGDKAKSRYAWVIIDRKSESENKVKILEVGWKIYEQLLSYAKDPEYGKLTSRNFKIKKSGEGRDTSYAVIASPTPTELSDEDNEMLAKSNIDLMNIFDPSRFGKDESENQKSSKAVTANDEEINLDEIPF